MSRQLERQRTKGSGASALPGTLPQVNLLPPEVRAARGLQTTKRWLGLFLVLTLVICAAGYALALVVKGSADGELTEAQDETARLQAEQAKYAEVPLVLNALTQVETARQLGMSTEIQWKPYLDAITAVLPEGVSIETFQVVQDTPMTVSSTTSTMTGMGAVLPVGGITFTGRTSTLPDTAAWIDALNSVPGFAGAWVSSATITDEDGVFYTVASSVVLTSEAYSGRFEPTEEGN